MMSENELRNEYQISQYFDMQQKIRLCLVTQSSTFCDTKADYVCPCDLVHAEISVKINMKGNLLFWMKGG